MLLEMITRLRQIACVATALAAGSPSLSAAPSSVSFNRDIRPILSENCFKCHGPDEKVRKAGLRLDVRDEAIRERKSGRAIQPGKPESSSLITRIHTQDVDDVMPPAETKLQLTAAQKDLLRQWIAQGAEYQPHWAFIAPVRGNPPPVKDTKWARNPVDTFLLAEIERRRWKTSPEDDRHTLIRRVSLDLTGLPPTPAEVKQFIDDKSPDAYEKWVDRLLAKPSYGEHWARMWLDLARYADSAGYADDPSRVIWAYRDWVIRALNTNLPFDQFTIDQIAGDLLANPTADQITATAFNRNTQTNSEGGTDDEEFRNVAVVDRVNTTLAVWMGTTMACAQCHNHKYDPISQEDYFRLFAIFNNTADSDKRDENPLQEIITEDQRKQKELWLADIAAINAKQLQPSAPLTAAAQAWARAFPFSINWNVPVPASPKAKSGAPAIVLGDRAISIEKNESAKDTITIELPIAEAQKLAALRLETMPNAGHAGGNFVLTRLHATLRPPASAAGPKARFIRLELPGKQKIIQIAEVQIFSGQENVARAGAASFSSTYLDALAARAIDGRTDGEYEKGSVAHSGQQDDPWWELDLKTATAIDRIVIWNRTELPERLAGFRLIALNEQRKVIWEKAAIPAPPRSAEIVLNGDRELRFVAALASFTQTGFDADNVIHDDAPKKDRTRGWAVGGAMDKPHTLTLIAAEPIAVPAGSRLIITLDHQSATPKATLGRFRLGVTADAHVTEHARTPADILELIKQMSLLAAPPQGPQADAMRSRITAYYVSNIWPEGKAEREKIVALNKKITDLKPVTVPVMKELAGAQRRLTHIHLRGNHEAKGDLVAAGFPAVYGIPAPAGETNRLAAARWIMDARNPLTARVIANRYWEAIYGTGLVRTSEDFGTQGELASHPEMLDWLATELVRLKWDTKAFLKLLVTTAAYRQSSRVDADQHERDPANRYLARGPRNRLSAEMVRDSALFVSGQLSAKMFGPPAQPPQPSLGVSAAFGSGIDWSTSAGEDKFRRGIYTLWRRSNPYPSMAAFDAPTRAVCTVRRVPTNTPLQALVTMNDPVYVEAAQALARRMVKEGGATTPEKAAYGFALCLTRTPQATETARLVTLFEKSRAVYVKDAAAAKMMATDPIGPLPEGMEAADLAAWTVVGNVLLNLDEMFLKR